MKRLLLGGRMREGRRHLRVEWISPGTIVLGRNQRERTCVVANLSNGGVKLSGLAVGTLPDEFGLRLTPSKEAPRKCRVIWRGKHEVGVEFEEPFPSLEKTKKARRQSEVV